jgi:hypothetical protein
MGDARTQKVANVLAQAAQSPMWQKLNEGNPWQMGEHMGIDETHAKKRTKELKNICLWCDEFFTKHV